MAIHTNHLPRTQQVQYSMIHALSQHIYTYFQHIIDKATKDFLLPPKNTFTPLFYSLPKIHKAGCRLHSIVFGCDGPTDNISAYITHFIQSLTSNLPSHIKDTRHILNLIEKHPPLPPNALLVTDPRSLHTNIPHEEGIAAMIYFMEDYKHLLSTNCPLPHIVLIILNFILKHSSFKLMDIK